MLSASSREETLALWPQDLGVLMLRAVQEASVLDDGSGSGGTVGQSRKRKSSPHTSLASALSDWNINFTRLSNLFFPWLASLCVRFYTIQTMSQEPYFIPHLFWVPKTQL